GGETGGAAGGPDRPRRRSAGGRAHRRGGDLADLVTPAGYSGTPRRPAAGGRHPAGAGPGAVGHLALPVTGAAQAAPSTACSSGRWTSTSERNDCTAGARPTFRPASSESRHRWLTTSTK